MMSKLEVGTFLSASSAVLSRNDLISREPANVDGGRGNIGYDFEGSLDCHKTSIVGELTRIIRPLGLVLSVKLTNSVVGELGDSE